MLSIHGNMSTEKRDAVVKDFASGKVEVLITSVMLTLLRDSLQCRQVIILCAKYDDIIIILTLH